MSRLYARILCGGLSFAVAIIFASFLCACGAGRYPSSGAQTVRDPVYPRGDQDRVYESPRAPVQPDRRGSYELHRYGLWIGAVDSFALTLVVGAIAVDGLGGHDSAATYMRVFGVLGYAFTGPVLHQINDNGWGSGGSFLVRTTMPLISALIAEYTYGCEVEFTETCDLATPYGLAIGAGIATAIDALVLARRWRPVQAERADALRIQPMAIMGRERTVVGVGLRF